MTAREVVVGIIADEIGVAPSSVDTSVPFKDMGADSLDVIEILCSVEEELGVDLEDFHPATPESLIRFAEDAKGSVF